MNFLHYKPVVFSVFLPGIQFCLLNNPKNNPWHIFFPPLSRIMQQLEKMVLCKQLFLRASIPDMSCTFPGTSFCPPEHEHHGTSLPKEWEGLKEGKDLPSGTQISPDLITP